MNINGQNLKIPTLLGLTVLLIGLGGAVFLTSQQQIFKTKASTSAQPNNITVVNLTATSASIYWQTAEETAGFVEVQTASTPPLTFKDERDQTTPKSHKFHFISLENLTPNTAYQYRINSGSFWFPPQGTFSLTTPAPSSSDNLPPIIGVITDSQDQPVKEALITLTNNNTSLATISKVAGNFVLPISSAIIMNNPSALLKVTDGVQTSEITLTLPLNEMLPPIKLGKNYHYQPTVTLTPDLADFDVNGDGMINSLDLSEIVKNINQANFNKKTDLNYDNKVNQQDVDLILKYLPPSR